jgi:hypothetical protein
MSLAVKVNEFSGPSAAGHRRRIARVRFRVLATGLSLGRRDLS